MAPTKAWVLDGGIFQEVLREVNEERKGAYMQFLDKVPLFSVLATDQKELVASTGMSLKFRKDDVVVREGESGNLFYMILSGIAEIT